MTLFIFYQQQRKLLNIIEKSHQDRVFQRTDNLAHHT